MMKGLIKIRKPNMGYMLVVVLILIFFIWRLGHNLSMIEMWMYVIVMGYFMNKGLENIRKPKNDR